MFCPNINNKEVIQQFNEIVESLGGSPLTVEEFKNKDLRNQREGVDYAAMEAAYKIWDSNDGNPIDYAPNGQPSRLFSDLLSHFNGNRQLTIKTKANTFSEGFKTRFNDQQNQANNLGIQNQFLDENGEPLYTMVNKQKPNDSSQPIIRPNKDEYSSQNTVTAEEISQHINTTKELIEFLKGKGLLGKFKSKLLNLLSKYNIPIKVVNEDNEDYAYYQSGTIYINAKQFNKKSDKFNARTIIHELVHAYTVQVLFNPRTEEEKRLVAEIKKAYNQYVERSKKDGTFDMYGFKDENEFIAEFMTNKQFQQVLYNTNFFTKALDNLKALFNKVINFFIHNAEVNDLISQNELRQDIYDIMDISIPSVIYTNARIYADTTEDNIENDWNSYIEQSKEDAEKINQQYKATIDNLNQQSTSDEYKTNMKYLLNEIYSGILNRMRSIDSRSNIETLKVKGQLKYMQSVLLQQNVADSQKMLEFVNDLTENNVAPLFNLRAAVTGDIQFSSKAILQFKQDYIGFYYNILRDIKDRLLSNPNYKELFGKDYDNFRAMVDSLYEKFDQAQLDIDQLIYVKVKNILLKYGYDAGSNTIKDFVENNLKSTNYDMSNALVRLTALGDKVNDEAVRIMFDMINTANKMTYTSTLYRGKRLINAANRFVNNGGKLADLYEKDENGVKTGYLIRPKKQGLLERKIKDFETKLRIKYGVEDGYTPSSLPAETRTAYYKELNQFTSKIAIRQYSEDYYNLFNNLSEASRNKREVSQYRIANFKKNHSREDGTFHIEDLDDKEYAQLQEIQFQKKQDANLFYNNGKPKESGTIDYEIAQELSQLNDALNDGVSYTFKNEGFDEMQKYYDKLLKDKKITKEQYDKHVNIDLSSEEEHIKQAKKEFSHEIDKYGTSEYQRWYQSLVDSLKFAKIIQYKKETLDEATYKRWYKRSVKVTTDQLFYKQLDNIDNKSVYKEDYLEYQWIKEQLRELQKQFKDNQLGVLNTTLINEECRKQIKVLNNRLRELSKKHKKDKSAAKVTDIARFVVSPYYAHDRAQAAKQGEIALARFELNETTVNPLTGEVYYSPYYRQLVPKDTSLIRIMPNSNFYEFSSNSKYINPEWKEGGPYYQPKTKDFDNSAQFNKVMSIEGGKEFYDLLVNTMELSNQMIQGHSKNDSYYMPMISGSVIQYLKNAGGKEGNSAKNMAKALINYAKDSFISVRNDDLGYRENFNEDQQQRPDGSKLNFIPINFVGERGLEDMGNLSNDLVYMYTAYYNMATNYANKQKIQPDVELILAQIGNREYKSDPNINNGIATQNKTFSKSGKETQLYQFAEKMLDMQLYGETMQSIYYNHGNVHLNISKALAEVASYGRLVNLGLNVTCASVGFITGVYGGLFSAIGGRDFGVRDYATQWYRTITNLFKSIRNVGNVATEDKNKAIMEMFGIANEIDNMFKDTHLDKFSRVTKREWAYGTYSMFDYVMKSTILNSIISNYRYVDGKFVTKEYFKLNFKGNKDIWKNLVSVYDILEVKNGISTPKAQYAKAFNAVRIEIIKKGLDICESADGMLTPEQKTQLQANALGMFLMMHRQYLPRAYAERVSQQKQFDYTYRRTQESLYRTIPRVMYQLYKDYTNYKEIGNLLKNAKLDESDKANLRRVSAELLTLIIVFPLCSMYIRNLADRDKRDILLNWIALVCERSMFEVGTPYNIVDLVNTFKTPSAIFGMLDNLNYFVSLPMEMIYHKFDSKTISRGAYKNWTHWEQSIFKMMPGHSLYETIKDPKSKRLYFENQIQK